MSGRQQMRLGMMSFLYTDGILRGMPGTDMFGKRPLAAFGRIPGPSHVDLMTFATFNGERV